MSSGNGDLQKKIICESFIKKDSLNNLKLTLQGLHFHFRGPTTQHALFPFYGLKDKLFPLSCIDTRHVTGNEEKKEIHSVLIFGENPTIFHLVDSHFLHPFYIIHYSKHCHFLI